MLAVIWYHITFIAYNDVMSRLKKDLTFYWTSDHII